MPSHQYLAIIRDVNGLIDDFAEAVLVHGKPCSFRTLAVLWRERSFAAVHWASESLNRCVLGAPSLRTQQTLFLSALNRTVCSASDQTAPEPLSPPQQDVQPPETNASVPANNPEPCLRNVPHRAPVCDLSWQQHHPLIPCIRRRDWQAQAAENRRKRAAHELQQQSRQATRSRHRTLTDVQAVPEARIGAVFVLYALYYTQPSKPYSHIYVSPDHCESLKQTTLIMKEKGVHEGVTMLRALAANDAFVWGLINTSKDSVPSKTSSAQPFLSHTPHTTVTDHSLRAAKLHLQQLAPLDASLKRELQNYTEAVSEVFSGASTDSVPDTMVSGAADHLTAQYAAAFRSVRAAILDKGLSKRKRAAEATAWHEELDAEIDAELEDDAERSRAVSRRQGLQLAVVGAPGEDAVQPTSSPDGPQGVQRALRTTAKRTAQRQFLSRQWIKFAQENSAG